MIQPNDLVLFQGDSITDAGRDRADRNPNSPMGLGNGYARMAALKLMMSRPSDNLRFLNRGISGNQVIHLAERWQADCLDLKPNVLSVLIGVNDTWRGFDGGVPVPVDRYAEVYQQILTQAREALPGIRLVLCEPFVLVTGAVTEAWLSEIGQRQQVVRDLAGRFDARRVDFQAAMNDAATKSPPEYWLRDGVHPTEAGHQLMADYWIRCVTG